MTNALYHAGSGTTVQFPAAPLRGDGDRTLLKQRQGYDSAGNVYVYAKPGLDQFWKLSYPQVPAPVLSDLRVFMQARSGNKTGFTWYDWSATGYSVRFVTGSLQYRETTPGRYLVSFELMRQA